MRSTRRSEKSTSMERLVELWAERYVPDTLSLEGDFFSISQQLAEVALPSGQAATVAKVQRYLEYDYDSISKEADILFSYIPDVVTLSEAQHLNQLVNRVYETILEIYQRQSLPAIAPGVTPVLAVEQLAVELEPLLHSLREQYKSAQDPRALAFITTPFHFSSQLLLTQLTQPEQVLLGPYFKFIEEQVCIPWQRICTATRNQPDSPTIALVQEMLPKSQQIAETVYRQVIELYPTHHSRQGGLSEPAVKASVIRDLNMFQGYLWLCLLEKSTAALEQELRPLCIMVFSSIEVSWELVRQTMALLVEELLKHTKSEFNSLLLPYIQVMQQLFNDCPAE